MKNTKSWLRTSAPVGKKSVLSGGFFAFWVLLTFLLPAALFAQPAISLSGTDTLLTGGSFGNVTVGSSVTKTLRISNSSTGTLSISSITSSNPVFAASPTSLTVAAGAVGVVIVSFAPTSTGTHTGTLALSHNATGSPSTVSLSGTGTASAISLSSTSLSFGDVASGSSGVKRLTISSVGRDTLLVSRITSSFFMFTVSPTSLTLAPGAAGTITVTFTPTGSAGLKGPSTLSIFHNAPGSPSTISMIGSLSQANPSTISLSPTSISFGSVDIGSSGTQIFAVSNTGTEAFSVNSITSSNPLFTVSPTSFSLAPGASQRVTVTFVPSGVGPQTGTLSISHSAEGSPAAVRLSGVGLKPSPPSNLKPSLSYSPDRLDFGNVAVNAAVPLPLTLYNRGSDALRIDSLRVTPPSNAFSVTAPAPNFIIAPGDSQAVSVSFRPSASGDVSASLTASTSDPDRRTLSIPLRGTGVPLTLSVDLNPAAGDQRQTRMYRVRPGAQIPVQVFVEDAPPIKGFSLRIAFDPRLLAFVPGSFVPGPLVPGLIGLANVQKDYVEVGGTTLEGGTGGGSGLLGTLTISVLQKLDLETRLSIPLLVWNRSTGDRQRIQTDIRATFTSSTGSEGVPLAGSTAGGGTGSLAPDFNRDGKIDFDDFFLFAAAFGTSSAQFDLDGDGAVGFTDFFLFAESFGK